jgi:hypothetical protein
MASQIYAILTAPATLYAHAFNAAGQVWNGSAFVAWSDGSRATYTIGLSRVGTSLRYAAAAPAGTANWIAYEQLAGAPADNDTPVWQGDVLQVAVEPTPAPDAPDVVMENETGVILG